MPDGQPDRSALCKRQRMTIINPSRLDNAAINAIHDLEASYGELPSAHIIAEAVISAILPLIDKEAAEIYVSGWEDRRQTWEPENPS